MKNHNSKNCLEHAPNENWWAPVWVDFLLDNYNREKMGSAIWLYLYLTAYADRQTGQLLRKYDTIAKAMITSTKSIQRWMKILRDGNYIETRRLVYGFHIQITNWRPVKGKNGLDKNVQSWISRVDKSEVEGGHFDDSDRTYSGERVDTSDISSEITESPNIDFIRSKLNQVDRNVTSKDSFKESKKKSTNNIRSEFEIDWHQYIKPAGNKENAYASYLKTVGIDMAIKRPIFLEKMKAYVSSISDPKYHMYGERFFKEWENIEVAPKPKKEKAKFVY